MGLEIEGFHYCTEAGIDVGWMLDESASFSIELV